MKIVKYTKSSDSKGNNNGGSGGGSSSETIQSPTRGSLERTIWGQYDEGDDIDGSMIVNGNITIKVIADKNYESDDDDDEGEDVEEETGGGSLFVEEDITVGKHLYVNHSHSEHKDEKVCLINEVELNTANIKKNADDIATNKSNIASNLSEINSLKSRVTTNEGDISSLKSRMSTAETNISNNSTAIDSLDVNMQLAETSIRNNAEEIAKLKQQTTANETAIQSLMPIGSIIMFSGTMAEIPENWAICNGENGTPNLIGKFIKAWTSSGIEGGSNAVTLTSSNIPKMNLNVDVAKENTDKEWKERLNKKIPTLDKIGERVIDKGGSTHWCLDTGTNEGDNGLLGVNYTTMIDDVRDYTYIGSDSPSAVTFEPSYYSLIYIMKIA